MKRLSDVFSALLVTAALLVAAAVGRQVLFPAAQTYADALSIRVVPDRVSLSAGGHLLHAETGTVPLVVFTDFTCPYCGDFHRTLAEFERRYPGRVRVVYRHHSGPAREHAVEAAIAAECAAEQGRFRHYADALFAHQSEFATPPWVALALAAGVTDRSAFEACLGRATVQERIESDLEAGRRLEVQATPTLLLGNQLVVGALSLEALEGWIREGYPEVLNP